MAPPSGTNGLEPVRDVVRDPQPKIADLDAFRTFAEQYGHLTQVEMADQWPEPISADTIGAALKKR